MQAVTLSKSLHISSLSACLSLIMPCYCFTAGLQPGHISAQPLQILQKENLFYTAPSFIILEPIQCAAQFCSFVAKSCIDWAQFLEEVEKHKAHNQYKN